MRKTTFAIITLCILTVAVGLSGCQLGQYTLAKRGDIDARIDKARVEVTVKMEDLRVKETGLLKQVIAEHQTREQAAADYLFKGLATYGTLKPEAINRPMMIIGQSVQQTAAQLPAASAAAQAATFKQLQTELDEIKTSTEALRAQYEKELGVARAVGEAKAKALEAATVQLQVIEQERVTVLANATEIERALQTEKDKVQDRDTAKAQEEAANAKRNENLKRWLMGGLGVIALAAGAAAVFVPIPDVKQYGTVVAIAAAGLAFAVPFITPFHTLIAVLCICIPIVLRLIWIFKREYQDHTDTLRGIQEIKKANPETFKKEAAPILDEWHTKETIQRIDERLKQVGDV